MKPIGEQIRERREQLSVSQAELANRIGLSDSGNVTISKYENGIRIPKESTLKKIAEALNCTLVREIYLKPNK